MTDKTERDALLSELRDLLLRQPIDCLGEGVLDYGQKYSIRDEVIDRITKALAAPAEGEVVVTRNEAGAIVAVTRQDKDGRVLSVIDSAGGSKDDFCANEGHVTGGTGVCLNCNTPQPAEGDGAVKCPECDGNGDYCLAGHSAHPDNWRKCEACNGAGKITRPAATAVVPAFDFDRARTLIGYVTGYCDATTLKSLSSDACVALRDLDAMLAAAPAAPKGGVVDEAMARRYLAAQKDYIGKVDAAFGRQVAGALHSDDVIGACMAGLTAALATGEQP